MKWSKVWLILQRELRDQLRDRRTLFTIAVLPLLLYPLIGMTMLQVAQFLQEHPNRILVLGAEFLPQEPVLLVGDRFRAGLTTEDQRELLHIDAPPHAELSEQELRQLASEEARGGKWDAVLFIPPNFDRSVDRYREASRRRAFDNGDTSPTSAADANRAEPPPDDQDGLKLLQPEVLVQAARDKSRIAGDRLYTVLRTWRRELVVSTGITQRLPASVFEPFSVEPHDVSEKRVRTAAAWSKILPFVLVIWALTGAFYPAVDLCAGEKERGTLETLLSSPARRSEIVWGKLLTVMTFSCATSLLNLVSMGMTGIFVMRNLPNFAGASPLLTLGPPPWSTLGWLTLALVPVSALFGALALALATMSRSTKEGQYYLMPLLLVSMPLILLAMLPATELTLGTSLIPVTGLLLLLRSVIEGELTQVLQFVLPVGLVTGACCLLAIRWAIDQFNRESVLFRESERFHLGYWLWHLVRDRSETPTVSESVLCAVLLLVIRFFSGFVLPPPVHWNDFVVTTLIVQIGLVAAPVLLMTFLLTSSFSKTLLLRRPTLGAVSGAVVLAVLLHPIALELNNALRQLYPLSSQTEDVMKQIGGILQEPHWAWVVALIAVLPAICEEIAFRGFILSGLRRVGHRWVAILITSVFFGLVHGVIQQSIAATIFGLVLSYLAIQSGSLVTVIVFHAVHNGLAVSAGRILPWLSDISGGQLFRAPDEGLYQGWIVALCGVLACFVLYQFRHMQYVVSDEEKLQHALDRQQAFLSA